MLKSKKEQKKTKTKLRVECVASFPPPPIYTKVFRETLQTERKIKRKQIYDKCCVYRQIHRVFDTTKRILFHIFIVNQIL